MNMYIHKTPVDGFGYQVIRVDAEGVQTPVTGRIFSEARAIEVRDFMQALEKTPTYEERTALDRFVDVVQTTHPNDMLLLAGVAVAFMGMLICSVLM